MNRILLCSAVLSLFTTQITFAGDKVPQSGTNLGNVRGGDFKQAQRIIARNCTKCHSRDRIDAALSAGKNMFIIQKVMEKRGAVLNAKEQEVLGIYWKKLSPLKSK
ncbi:MAG: cytochrome C [Steroidobacteraceae bacterium]|nr:cytochrome C [Deltaproteobacteria bacterium]